MLEFNLYRIKLSFPAQRTVFDADPSARPVLTAAVLEKPTKELRKGYEWHIGNVERLDGPLLYFAFGRITKSTVQWYDQELGNFVDTEFEIAPYTHVVLDTQLGVAAIARNSKLAPTPSGIGRQLKNLISMADAVLDREALVDVAPINDPEEFIQQLKNAFAVTRFSMTFTRPNPFDVEEHFHQPMEALLRESHGHAGRTTVKGDNLDPEVLEPLARSAAATGNDANATLKRSRKGRKIRRGIRNNPAAVLHPEPDTREEKQSLGDKIREAYAQLRQRERD